MFYYKQFIDDQSESLWFYTVLESREMTEISLAYSVKILIHPARSGSAVSLNSCLYSILYLFLSSLFFLMTVKEWRLTLLDLSKCFNFSHILSVHLPFSMAHWENLIIGSFGSLNYVSDASGLLVISFKYILNFK